MSTDESPAPSATTVAELQQTVADLVETVEAQQERIDGLEDDLEFFENHFWQLEELVAGETGTTAADMIANEQGDVFEQLESLRQQSLDTQDGMEHVSEQVRNRMLPLHQLWTDVKSGNGDHLGAMTRRAAHLFGEFISAAAGRGCPTVDSSYQTYSMTSSDAGEFLKGLEPHNDSIDSSQTVKRVFESFEGKTQHEDDDEPLFDHRMENGTRTLSVEKRKFEALMQNVESAINGEVTVGSDDSGDSDEVSADAKARKKMDELERGSR